MRAYSAPGACTFYIGLFVILNHCMGSQRTIVGSFEYSWWPFCKSNSPPCNLAVVDVLIVLTPIHASKSVLSLPGPFCKVAPFAPPFYVYFAFTMRATRRQALT